MRYLEPMVNPPPLYRDPWAKREAWRRHPVFSNRAMFRNFFPGFGIAVVAFTAYVIADNTVLKAQPEPDGH
jgi:NADH dehydrogenase (ubiquinone) 1 beta subcomplex subunit 3